MVYIGAVAKIRIPDGRILEAVAVRPRVLWLYLYLEISPIIREHFSNFDSAICT